jgi:quercetin dioxygenase-like cupin family protein
MADPRLKHWPKELQDELEANRYYPCVGTTLVSETERVRVWHLVLPPGARAPFHRHVLDYFWTCHSQGKGEYYYEDGQIIEKPHFPGQTKQLSIKAGEYMFHSVRNIGDTDLIFTTVEFMQSANPPIALPDSIRAKAA